MATTAPMMVMTGSALVFIRNGCEQIELWPGGCNGVVTTTTMGKVIRSTD